MGYQTIEATIDEEGKVHFMEAVKLPPHQKVLIILLPSENKKNTPHDFDSLYSILESFSDDFMAQGRMQPAMQEREDL